VIKGKESKEDYLEAILVLKLKGDTVREVDVAHYLNFSKPSVTIAMKKLIKDDLVELTDEHKLELTTKGYETASKTYDRHLNITRFLEKLGVDHATASDDACQMEHDISEKTFQIMKNYFKGKK